MAYFSKQERIEIFKSLFRGREDVFAQRWESRDGSRSGYFPVYKDKERQEYKPLNQWYIEQHLLGNRVIGLYPLLTDNTSWFIAADFDREKWLASAKRLFKVCQKHNLPCYIERSRSGKGGHVWWFFKEPYPAIKSRKIFLHLIKESKNISQFDIEDSFDRLFPNQDYLTGKGLGNLIALPLQGQARRQGNTVFLDPDNKFAPSSDQWEFLSKVERIPNKELDNIYEGLADKKEVSRKLQIKDGELPIILSNYISLPKQHLNKALANFLKDNLNFFNIEHAVKQKMGLSTYKTEKYFKTIIEKDEEVLLPRGFLNRLIGYLTENEVSYVVDDQRQKFKSVKFNPTFKLLDYQQKAVENLRRQDQGLLVAPPGSGKTIMALALIAEKKQLAIIIVHRKQIYNQWLERIEEFMNIPKRKIGQISSIKKEPLSPITVAMIHTLSRMKDSDLDELSKQFGLVMVDECHHMPARMFRQVVPQFNTFYLYGLTATPTRRHNDEKLIFIYLGDIIYQLTKDYKKATETKPTRLEVVIRETNFSLPHKVSTRNFSIVSRILIYDTQRNELIFQDIVKEVQQGHKCLILTDRKEQVEVLSFYLQKEFEVIALTGTLGQRKRKERHEQLKSGHYQVIIATGQLLGEGTSLGNLDCLFLVFPLSYKGKLAQYIGRIEHGKSSIKIVYDYRDKGVDYLEKMFKQRKKFYDTL